MTGPKTDIWLGKTVAVLLLPISLVFLIGSFMKKERLIIVLVGITSSAGLAFVDFYYTMNKTIKWVYQVDGYIELLFLLLLWIYISRGLYILDRDRRNARA